MFTRAIFSLVVGGAFLALAGCGFEPLLASGRGSNATAEMAQIRVVQIPERSGQILRQYVLDRISPRGTVARPAYTLAIQLNEPRQVLALRRDDIISRSGYSAAASFVLSDVEGQRIAGGTSYFSTDYEIASSEYATLVSRDSARDRVLELIGDDIATQIAEFFRDRATGVAKKP